ncbi:Ger(x)C family spore germination protein [Alkaliphilus hydrothermalis]|uniref:Ger(X)C family germination protein n=1 Tax=Alkaliphilus hydrothermalis TaxID=1482730 RepID=A0ABS2NSZ5_9FIRM|nr:Ger(x)C family spore germination protein [Alkaliphilus hydrothermalis]MBM7615951.1 Ger(x)C family germination protein [Alkaliphilus hydrothermalis]
MMLTLIITLSMFLTACWDKTEINDRAFVLALGIDHIPPSEQPKEDREHKALEKVLGEHAPHYRMTYAFPKQMLAGGEPTVENIIMSSVGENIYINERQMKARVDNQLFLGHLKSVVLGEEVVKTPQMFREVLDALEKDPLISRKVNLAIAVGEAKEVLNVEPKQESISGQFITDLFMGEDRTNRAPVADLDQLFISLHDNSNAAIPRLTGAEEELKLGGAAIIKNYEFVGWIGELESMGLMILKNETDIFVVTINADGINIPYQVTEIKTVYTIQQKDKEIKMLIEIEAEGDIVQYFFDPEEDVLDPALLEKLEQEVEKKLQGIVMHTVEKLQKDLETDVLGFDTYIKRHNPDLWAQVGKDWVEIFPTVEVEVVVDAKIRRVGLTK